VDLELKKILLPGLNMRPAHMSYMSGTCYSLLFSL